MKQRKVRAPTCRQAKKGLDKTQIICKTYFTPRACSVNNVIQFEHYCRHRRPRQSFPKRNKEIGKYYLAKIRHMLEETK